MEKRFPGGRYPNLMEATMTGKLKKRLSLTAFVGVLLTSSLFGYSGDDLTGMIEMRQIAQMLQVHAHEHDGKISIPYEEVPGVSWSVERLQETRGTLVLGDNESFSLREPVPIGFYSVGGVVIVGFSDGTSQYYRHTDRPPWVGLREGLTLWQRLMIASPILNFLLIVIVVDMWRSNREKLNHDAHETAKRRSVRRVGAIGSGLLTFFLAWIILELVLYVGVHATASRLHGWIAIVVAALLGIWNFQKRIRVEEG